MHARVVTVQFRAGATEEAVRIYRERVLAAARQYAGFRGLLVLIDPATGKGMSVSLWDDADGLADAEAGGALPRALSELARHTTSPRFREVFRVEVMSMEGSPAAPADEPVTGEATA